MDEDREEVGSRPPWLGKDGYPLLLKGVAAWTIGLVYISYDSLLSSFMAVSSQEKSRKKGDRHLFLTMGRDGVAAEKK
jgi:hypothetical protein